MRLCDELVGRGYFLTIETYTMFMSGLCKECRLDEAKRLFMHICELGLFSNFVIYTMLMNECYKLGSMDEACYQLIYKIVGFVEETPFDKHDKCLCSSVSDDLPFVPSQFWLVSFYFQ